MEKTSVNPHVQEQPPQGVIVARPDCGEPIPATGQYKEIIMNGINPKADALGHVGVKPFSGPELEGKELEE